MGAHSPKKRPQSGAAKAIRYTVKNLEELVDKVQTCPSCHIKHATLHQKCHPNAGVILTYDQGSCDLSMHCVACNTFLGRIGVALV